MKKLDAESLKKFRDRFHIPLSDSELENVPYYRPAPDSPEMVYMRERRESLGGSMPQRRSNFEKLTIPKLDEFSSQIKGSGKREISSTMAFVRILSTLVKDKNIGSRIVPIVPDEARTFGMEGMFRQLGIYSSQGQLYTPHDAGGILYYKEDEKGQIMEEGINESGSMSAWLAAATSYSTNNKALVPFYVFYSRCLVFRELVILLGLPVTAGKTWVFDRCNFWSNNFEWRGFTTSGWSHILCLRLYLIVFLMIQHMLMKWLLSFKMVYTECMRNKKISFITLLP